MTSRLDPWVCDQCGGDMHVEQTSEFGPVSLYQATCEICGLVMKISVERMLGEHEEPITT